MKAYTDYPFEFLGDQPYMIAPIREIKIISYDGDKYCHIEVEGHETEIKVGYIYEQYGYFGDTSQISIDKLLMLDKEEILY